MKRIGVALAVVFSIGFARAEWTYSGGKISDGNWTLSASARDKTAQTLNITGYTAGSGLLDLTTLRADTGWTVAGITAEAVFNKVAALKAEGTAMTGIIAPDLVAIVKNAFPQNSTYFTKFVASENLASLNDNLFSGAVNLTEFSPRTFPQLTSIGSSTFKNCSSLTGSFSFPAAKSVDANAFNGCSGLTEIHLAAVETIGNSAFSGSSNLTTVELSEKLVSIGETAFQNLTKLTSLGRTTFPNLTTICKQAFYNCTALAGAYEFPALTTLGSNNVTGSAFYKTAISSFIAPKLIVFKGSSHLSECPELEFVSLASATNLPNYFCSSCPKLKTVLLPKIQQIGGGGDACVFSNCSKLTTVEFSEDLHTISKASFRSCTALETITPVKLPNLKYIGQEAFRSCTKLNTRLEIGALTSDIQIISQAFFGCENLLELAFEGSVKSLEASAFTSIQNGFTLSFANNAAPPTFASNALQMKSSSKDRAIFRVKDGAESESWQAIATALTDDDLKRTDYPGKKTFGIKAFDSSNKAWLVAYSDIQGTVMSVR